MIRDILDYKSKIIGQMELPDDTSEETWTAKLAPYAKAPPSDQEKADSYLMFTIKERKDYAEDLLERFKQRNIKDGINALQGMYMHHRVRALVVTFYAVPMVLDLPNMAISGDIEIACLALMNCSPDDMSLPFHWLSKERRDWLVNDMKAYLGWA